MNAQTIKSMDARESALLKRKIATLENTVALYESIMAKNKRDLEICKGQVQLLRSECAHLDDMLASKEKQISRMLAAVDFVAQVKALAMELPSVRKI
jgi:hypothetical protein